MPKKKDVICWRKFGVVKDSNGKEVDLSNAEWLINVKISKEDQQPALRLLQDQVVFPFYKKLKQPNSFTLGRICKQKGHVLRSTSALKPFFK